MDNINAAVTKVMGAHEEQASLAWCPEPPRTWNRKWWPWFYAWTLAQEEQSTVEGAVEEANHGSRSHYPAMDV
jgi:hypothetical protein